MSYTYTVNKRKSNRISYRVLGIIFLTVTVLQCIILFRGYANYVYITALFALVLGCYGIYLVRMSFRKQAFNITYVFNEEGLSVNHKYGDKKYTFDDIEFITMVIADQSMIFYVLNIKAGKDIYTIPFTMKRELCEKIYEFVNSRIKHEEDATDISSDEATVKDGEQEA